MSELIVAGFDDAHNAFLARAALARMQEDLEMDGYDVAIMSRGPDGAVIVREAIDLNIKHPVHKALWGTLVGFLFPGSIPDDVDSPDVAAAALSRIGLGNGFKASVANAVAPGTSAVLVLAKDSTRDRTLGLLQGFQARIVRARLIGENRGQWMEALSREEQDGSTPVSDE